MFEVGFRRELNKRVIKVYILSDICTQKKQQQKNIYIMGTRCKVFVQKSYKYNV